MMMQDTYYRSTDEYICRCCCCFYSLLSLGSSRLCGMIRAAPRGGGTFAVGMAVLHFWNMRRHFINSLFIYLSINASTTIHHDHDRPIQQTPHTNCPSLTPRPHPIRVVSSIVTTLNLTLLTAL
jgi:hypothetical protein